MGQRQRLHIFSPAPPTSTRSGLWNHWCLYLTPAGLSGKPAATAAAEGGAAAKAWVRAQPGSGRQATGLAGRQATLRASDVLLQCFAVQPPPSPHDSALPAAFPTTGRFKVAPTRDGSLPILGKLRIVCGGVRRLVAAHLLLCRRRPCTGAAQRSRQLPRLRGTQEGLQLLSRQRDASLAVGAAAAAAARECGVAGRRRCWRRRLVAAGWRRRQLLCAREGREGSGGWCCGAVVLLGVPACIHANRAPAAVRPPSTLHLLLQLPNPPPSCMSHM